MNVTIQQTFWMECREDRISRCWFLQRRLLKILLDKGRGQMVFWVPFDLTVQVIQRFNQKLRLLVSVEMFLHLFHEVNVTVVGKGLTSVSGNIFISCFLLIKVVSKIVCFP